MATRDQISAKVRQFLNDAGTFYNVSDINDSLQDGYDEVAALNGCIEKITPVSFSLNTAYYDMPVLIPDYLTVVGIWNRRVKRWMVPVSLRQMDALSEKWEITTGEPFAFCPINYRYIAVFPAINAIATAETNRMFVVHKATADTLIETTEPQIPVSIQEDILLNYTAMDMFEQAEEWTKSQEFFNLYLGNNEELKKLINTRDKERMIRLGGNL